jgi:hypothetical protein
MVYKCKFLKQVVENDFDPTLGSTYTWELSDQPLAAVWLTIKGDLYAIDKCIDDICSVINNIDLWFGGFNVIHYATTVKALLTNCKLKGNHPYLVNSSQIVADVTGVSFPLMLGAPYLNESMCLPESLSNRKKLTLGFVATSTNLADVLIDISEVIMPDAHPSGFIKQEEQSVTAPSTGDHDVWLQTNWDLLKLILWSTTVPTSTAYTSTIERAGLEINDFAFGYKSVPWEHLHAEMMDELSGATNGENHQHLAAGATSNTGMPFGLEHWISHFGELDFFFNYDLKWRAPTAGASTVKLKYNAGVAEAFYLIPVNYVPTSKVT